MERIDDLQYKGLKLIQDTDGFCFGCDAVELANFTEGCPKDYACDLGCGNGIIPVLLAVKRGMKTVGVEIQKAAASLAERNAALNNLSDMITVVNGSMQSYAALSENAAKFSVVTCNPPYRKKGSGLSQQSQAVKIARHEYAVTLSEVVQAASKLLKFGGKFFTVGQTERLAETIQLCCEQRLTPKVLQILRPCPSKPPYLFLLKCIKEGAHGLAVLPERDVKTYGME